MLRPPPPHHHHHHSRSGLGLPDPEMSALLHRSFLPEGFVIGFIMCRATFAPCLLASPGLGASSFVFVVVVWIVLGRHRLRIALRPVAAHWCCGVSAALYFFSLADGTPVPSHSLGCSLPFDCAYGNPWLAGASPAFGKFWGGLGFTSPFDLWWHIGVVGSRLRSALRSHRWHTGAVRSVSAVRCLSTVRATFLGLLVTDPVDSSALVVLASVLQGFSVELLVWIRLEALVLASAGFASR